MSAILGVFTINGHNYAPFLKQKTGLKWTRENTNDQDAKRDAGLVMHPQVTSHQRKLEIKMGPMTLEQAQQLEQDLQGNDNGVEVQYPDIHDGVCTRLFYNTSISAAIERFTDDGVMLDDLAFTLITVKEAILT